MGDGTFMHGRRQLLAGLALPLAGCAGFRGGVMSVAYVGDDKPTEEPRGRPSFDLPGVMLGVELDNRVRSRDTQVWFYVVPVSIDPRDVYEGNHVRGRTRARVAVQPFVEGVVFRPSAAVLSFGGARHTGVAGSEFGQWDGRWQDRPRADGFVLDELRRRYLLSIDFPTPVPDPRRPDITLDLAAALPIPGHPPLPLVRFAPVRWSEGYT